MSRTRPALISTLGSQLSNAQPHAPALSSRAPNKPNRRSRPEWRSGVPDRSRTDLALALSSPAPNKPNLPNRCFMINSLHKTPYSKSGLPAWAKNKPKRTQSPQAS